MVVHWIVRYLVLGVSSVDTISRLSSGRQFYSKFVQRPIEFSLQCVQVRNNASFVSPGNQLLILPTQQKLHQDTQHRLHAGKH